MNDKERNREEIFCLIGSFLGRLKGNNFAIRNDKSNKFIVFNKEDELVITDKTRNKIINDLVELFDVYDKDEIIRHKVIK